MKNKRRIVCLVLAIVFCLGMYPAAFGSGSINLSIEDGVLTVSGSGSTGTLDFTKSSVTKIIVEEGITTLSAYAFDSCTALTEICLPASLTKIENGAFDGCNAIATIRYAGTEEDRASISIGSYYNGSLKDAEWIYSDTVITADSSFSLSSAQVTKGSTASVTLSLDKTCTGLGARFVISAKDSAGNTLPISSVTLGEELGGAVNSSNDGTIVLASSGTLSAGTTLATIVFDASITGSFILSLSGEAYTGADNTPLEYSVTAGTITVTEPTVTVTWKNYDGSILKTDTLDIGATPSYSGATPTRAADTLYTYSFSGWTPEITTATQDAVYTARFASSPRSYSVSIGCGIDGAEVSVKNSAGTALTPNADGSFTLVCGQSYICTVKAVGYEAIETSISVNDSSGSWSYSDSSATLTLSTPEKAIGDMNNDGDVDMTDAQALYNYLAGNYSLDSAGIAYGNNGGIVFNLNVADINGNGSVGADDILPMLELVTAGAG